MDEMVMCMTPDEYAKLQELSIGEQWAFDAELERLRQLLGVPVGTDVRVEVVNRSRLAVNQPEPTK